MVIVFLSSCGSAETHASTPERFRRSENMRRSAASAMGIPLFLLFSQARELISHLSRRWSGAASIRRPSAFQGTELPRSEQARCRAVGLPGHVSGMIKCSAHPVTSYATLRLREQGNATLEIRPGATHRSAISPADALQR